MRKKFLILIVMLSMIVVCSNSNALLVPIKVISLTPAPKYLHSGNEVERLTDGKTEFYPIWIRKGCVAWGGAGLVQIMLQVGEASTRPISGKLLLHTARGTIAGVHIPARIDVYAQRKDQKFTHAAGMSFRDEDFADKQNHWLSLEVDSVQSPILVIVRANGNYIAIDEIQWEEKVLSSTKIHPLVGDAAACVKDSLERHRQFLLANVITLSKDSAREWTKAFGNEKQVMWVPENPYDPLPLYPSAAMIASAAKEIHISGTRSERESACLGLLNLTDSDQDLTISVEGESKIAASVSLREVAKILVADGSQVYDPLLPLKDGHHIIAPAKLSAYLWIQADLRSMPPGQHRLSILVRDHTKKVVYSVPLILNVIDQQLPVNRRPAAFTWAYSIDLPIWRNPAKAVADLVDHGINVFLIHPSKIPMPTLTGQWNGKVATTLADDISLYRGKGLILLHLGWRPGQPAWLKPLSDQNIALQKAALQAWVWQLYSFLKGLGLSEKEWALYPVDEPHSDLLPYLRELAKWMKEAAPSIQIYANPDIAHSYRTTSADLIPLSAYIDLWQPALNLATGPAASFFTILTNLSRPWWIYDGPPAPAKAASPWHYYRLLSWRSWAAGAKGVGVWSYSDTTGTTAWDDLDGRRPDFALVYEGNDGPISSRRWEAFRKGLEDFQLLEAVAQGDLPSSAKLAPDLKSRVKELLNQSPVPSFARVEALRHEMLQAQKDLLHPK